MANKSGASSSFGSAGPPNALASALSFIETDFPGVSLSLSRRAKRLALRLDSKERRVRFVVPHRASAVKALEFFRANEGWVAEHIAALPAPFYFVEGAVLPVLGEDLRLEIDRAREHRTTSVAREGDILRIRTNRDDVTSRLTSFLKKSAEDEIRALATEKSARIGKAVRSLALRDTKTRWGSCATGGRLSFSWRLVFAPPAALDYVVAHEVAHMRHMDHSRNFWNLCRDLSRDYEGGKTWMRVHGHTLLRYGHPLPAHHRETEVKNGGGNDAKNIAEASTPPRPLSSAA